MQIISFKLINIYLLLNTKIRYKLSKIKGLILEFNKSALLSLIKHFTQLKGEMSTMDYVIHALNARYVLNRNTNPKVAKIFKQDRDMISKMYKEMKMKKM